MTNQEKEFISQMIELTDNGKIDWENLNELVYIWKTHDKDGRKVNVLLQTLNPKNRSLISLLFRVYLPDKQDTKSEIESESLPRNEKGLLIKLFSSIRNYIRNKESDFFSGILDQFD